MRRIGVWGLVLAAAWAAGADSSDYLKVRKGLGITQAVGVEALETLVGTRVLEIEGVVKGTMTANGSTLLLLEGSGGEPMYVSTPQAPDWMQGNAMHVRLIVRASREAEGRLLDARLIHSAPDHAVRAEEDRIAREEAAKAPKAPPAKRPASGASRGNVARPVEWNVHPHAATPHYAAFIKSRNKRLSDEEAMLIATGIIGFSVKYGVDARLIMAMVMVESGFDPGATSSSGAMGLGQLMPGTARGMGVGNPYDSIDNLSGTVRLVRGHLDKYGQQKGESYEALVLALAAYNAGSGAVRRHGGVPPYRETQNYIRKVINAYKQFAGLN